MVSEMISGWIEKQHDGSQTSVRKGNQQETQTAENIVRSSFCAPEISRKIVLLSK